MKIILEKSFIREFPPVHVQMWGRRYADAFLDEPLPTIPLYVFKYENGLVTAYRNSIGQTEAVNSIIKKKIGDNPKFIDWLVASKKGELDNLERLKDKPDISLADFNFFLDELFDYWQLHYVAQFVPLDEARFSKETRERAMELRKTVDTKIVGLWNAIAPILKKLYPNLGNLVAYISWDEIKNNNLPTLETLKMREKNGIILFNDQIVDGSKLKKLSAQYGFSLESDSDIAKAREIYGLAACGGKAKGAVKKIFRADDVKFFSDGAILVSYMTMPSFAPAMRKAAAFVTDEGGITCHAAIFAREMNKPCIIGTKIATKVLKDGDLVEVDADMGIVRIIK